MKKLTLMVLGLLCASLTANAQLENYSISIPAASGPVLVGGAPTEPAPIVYTQPVVYTAPVQYFAPVVYNAPVIYSAPPVAPVLCSSPVNCAPSACGDYDCSTVQVIPFGHRQAYQQGYAFNARR